MCKEANASLSFPLFNDKIILTLSTFKTTFYASHRFGGIYEENSYYS